ncbi:purine-cytosine permease family protein [Demetria terragena]|uniref:purine-cytosine permease family protein n=1 Tax=Demetria terragena TaxID=63959 RepID=UPI000365D2AF|nr:hypothetical protein [Demetria terragena]
MSIQETKASPAEMDPELAAMDPEQLPVPEHRTHGAGHFAGLYAAEHVAATEFVFGATFVALGAGIWDILIGLIIGNTLAMLSFRFITAPIAVKARLSLYTYLQRIAGDSVSRVYNAANAIIFAVISAAMITVSATAVRGIFGFPAQESAYPTHIGFIIIALVFSAVAVLVAVFGFDTLAEFASICGPWLMVMFTVGGMVLLPMLTETIAGTTRLTSFDQFIDVASSTVFTGVNSEGEPGIGLWEVAGFAWAANTFAHFGLIDMALLRYAKKARYAYGTATGMMFGHYIAWIAAGLMGAAVAQITATSIAVLEPGDVAWHALGAAGFVTVIVAGWTTANSNIYRAGLAGQAVFPNVSRVKVTLAVGVLVMVASVFPFVYRNMLPLLTYAGLLLVPIGGIIFAEHHLFHRMGMTQYWSRYRKQRTNVPAFVAWGGALVVGFGLQILQVIPYYYLFIPAWFASIIIYTVLAKRAGAGEDYAAHIAEDEEFNERVRLFHERRAATEDPRTFKDSSIIGHGLRAVWILSLVAILVMAWNVLFRSGDLYEYYVNLDRFYLVALVGTIVYFVTTWGALQRTKWLAKKHLSSESREAPPIDTTQPARRAAPATHDSKVATRLEESEQRLRTKVKGRRKPPQDDTTVS